MPQRLNSEEIFEDRYTSLFETRFGHLGAFVNYKRDRAALDVGMHLRASGSMNLSNVRVWFQFKGIHKETLSADQVRGAEFISRTVSVDDVQRWYAAPEAVYLVVYIEALDTFVGGDIRDIVNQTTLKDGTNLSRRMANLKQESVTLHVRTSEVIDENRISAMLRHKSMRIDGPSWRGRPLGHHYDPLRCELSALAPEVFVDMCEAILSAHRFRVERRLDAARLLVGVGGGSDDAQLLIGTMYDTYEWLIPITVEFGFDPNTDFRGDGETRRVQGRVAVLVHSAFGSHPGPAPAASALLDEMRSVGVRRVLVMANAPDALLISPYRSVLRDLYDFPQGQGSLAYTLLTSPTVFMELQDRISWKIRNYLWEGPPSRVSLMDAFE